MATTQMNCVLRHVRKLIGLPRERELTDSELLQGFTTRRDNACFEALVQRHGPLVLRVCRRVLNDGHAAEDAFQATFLVLARKAPSIRQRGSIAGWLYEVANRVALRARTSSAKRRLHERQAGEMVSMETVCTRNREETQELIDEELRRLPEKYRTPLVLCYLEGKTNEQAARELGCPIGSMSGLLMRGRELLRDRLAGRGVALSTVGLTTLLLDNVASAAVPAALVESTVQAAALFAAGQATVLGWASAEAVALAEGVLKAMITSKLKWAAMAILALGLVGSGTRLLVADNVALAPETVLAADTPSQAPAEAPKVDAAGDPLPPDVQARLGTLRWRHGANVFFVAYANSDKELLTVSQDGVVHIWEVGSGKELRKFGKAAPNPNGNPFAPPAPGAAAGRMMAPLQLNALNGVAATNDRKILALGTSDSTITFWNVAEGKEICSFKVVGFNQGMAFSPDGKLLAVKSADNFIRLFDSEGKETKKFGTAPVQPAKNVRVLVWGGVQGAISFSPDGKVLFSVGGEYDNNKFTSVLKRFDIESGKEQPAIKGPEGGNGLSSMMVAPDGKSMAVGGNDGTVRIWDLEGNKEKQKLTSDKPMAINAQAFSADGKWLATRTFDQAIHIWDVANGKEVHTIGGPGAGGQNGQILVGWGGGFAASNLAFSSDSKLLASGTTGNTVRQWDTGTGKEVARVGGHHNPVATLGISADGKTVATRAGDNVIHIWDAVTGKETRNFELPAGVSQLLFSADGQLAVLSGTDGSLRSWDVKAGKEIKEWQAPVAGGFGGFGGVSSLALTADGKTVAVRASDQMIHLYETATGKELKVMGEAPAAVNPNGAVTVWGFFRGGVMMFSPHGTILATLSGGNNGMAAQLGAVNVVRPAPQGNGSAELFDVASGKRLLKFTTDSRAVVTAVFSPNGRVIATANADNSISLWETASGKERLNFKSNATSLAALLFTPDGKALIGSGADHIVRFYSATTGTELKQLKGHQSAVVALAISADGKTLVSGSVDTTALVYNITGAAKEDKPAPVELETAKADALWNDLADADGKKAFVAILTLSTAPKQAVPLLAERVKAVAVPDNAKLKQLIADLEADKPFKVRQKANDDLEKLGELATDALQKVLAEKPGLEMETRIKRLLDRLVTGQAPPADVLRGLRALEVLEQLGTADARQAVETIGKGAAGARLTRQAQETLQRMPK